MQRDAYSIITADKIAFFMLDNNLPEDDRNAMQKEEEAKRAHLSSGCVKRC